MPHLDLDTLYKEFSVKDRTIVAVDGVSIGIEEGEFFTFIGPSGCGKTTTLRCIAGLETPTSGTITLDGVDITDVPPNKRDMAMMFQNIALYPHMRVRDNISYPLKVEGAAKSDRYARAREIAASMQIEDLFDKYPGDLSGGQRQRTALARTVIQDASVFLMDEPLSDLDAKLKVEMRKEIQRVHKQGNYTTVYVTHDQEVASAMSDRIAVMNQGKIVQVGTPTELYNNPKNLFVAKFIGTPSMNIFPARLDRVKGEAPTVTVGSNAIELAPDPQHPLDDTVQDVEVLLGIRPEAVGLANGESPDIAGEVQLLEEMGNHDLATVDMGGTEFQSIVSTDSPLSESNEGEFTLSREDIYLFDSTSGDLLTKSTAQA